MANVLTASTGRSVGRPYCGDRVEILRADGQSAVVTRILPRDNVFVRADARQRKQPIAANLDQALIIIAPYPAPSRDLVERYLVAIHSLGIQPVIVLNKAELMLESEYDNNTPLGRMEDYRKLGYEVVHTSCKTAPGISSLKTVLENRTSILVGQSGSANHPLVNSPATGPRTPDRCTIARYGERHPHHHDNHHVHHASRWPADRLSRRLGIWAVADGTW